MTVRRWATTTGAMVLVGLALLALAPAGDLVRAAVEDPQALTDTRGPDALLVLLAWVAAAVCWAWGSLGLVLTGLSTLPGVAGRVAGSAALVLLPAGVRRAAAVAVGVSLVAGPVLATPEPAPRWAVASSDVVLAPDWPVAPTPAPVPAPPEAPPDWPTAVPDGAHVVVRGDTLWGLAEARLAALDGAPPTPAAVAAAVQAWWQANADVVGPDPDRLLPGQVLTPPAS